MKMNYQHNEKGVFHSFANEPENFQFLLNLKTGSIPTESLQKMDGQIIEVSDCMISNFGAKDENGQPITNEDGKQKMRHKLTLISPDKKCYTTYSEKIYWKFMKICSLIGYPDWREGYLKFKISCKPTEDGKTFIDFEVL